MLGADSCDRPAPRRGAQMRSCAYMLCSEKLKKPGSVPNCDKRHLYLLWSGPGSDGGGSLRRNNTWPAASPRCWCAVQSGCLPDRRGCSFAATACQATRGSHETGG